MIDPLAGFDMGPNDIFYDGPAQKPVIEREEQPGQSNPHPMHQSVGMGAGELTARVARLEEQVRRLFDLAGLG